MEEVDFFDFSDVEIPPVTFCASYDSLSGRLLSVGPKAAFFGKENIIPIDEDIAKKIINGEMSLRSCVVNLAEGELEISEVRSLHKIDDVLHRIPEDKFAESDSADLFVTYIEESQELIFALSEEHQGVRKSAVPKKKRKVTWGGETVLHFYVTDYNDPNVLHQRIEFTVTDLIGKTLVVKLECEFDGRFSIYTRRLFKNYILEKK